MEHVKTKFSIDSFYFDLCCLQEKAWVFLGAAHFENAGSDGGGGGVKTAITGTPH